MTLNTNSPVTTASDMEQSRQWTTRYFSDPGRLPVSFLYGGHVVNGIPQNWNPVFQENRIDANILQTIFRGQDAETGLSLKVECLEYRDYPVVEWTAWLTNEGDQATPIISELQAVDGVFEGHSPVLTHCNGDFYSLEGYTPQNSPLGEGDVLTFASTGGRSCDGAFPYYRLVFEGHGISLAIGWPGQWSVSFLGTVNGVKITAGQEKTHLRLMPGETVRTPRITLLSWRGTASRSINLWRRWYLAHVLPRPDGQPMRPLMALAATDPGEEFTAATEENQLSYMDRFKDSGFDFDVWWIDAGWYPCYNENHERRWWNTGHWVPDPERFPNGFRPISERAGRYGAKLLVWFEPERVHTGSWLDQNHPEWLLRSGNSPERLLNLGNPEYRVWLTSQVNDLIHVGGIGIYRQDFNFEPLNFWRDNDPDDRQGINENFHVQGYLQYWDDLLKLNPGLWIDSCSSGGRRNDLETMRRSVPLHYTDYGYGIHPVKLSFHHTLFQWIPYFKESTLSWDLDRSEDYPPEDRPVDPFSFHCGMAAMLFPIINVRSSYYDHKPEVDMALVWRKVSEMLLYGDYYPLTPFNRSPDRWVAWQFDRPERGEGFVQAIRLADCPEETHTVYLEAILPEREYIFENLESGEKRTIKGSLLVADGFGVTLPAAQRSDLEI